MSAIQFGHFSAMQSSSGGPYWLITIQERQRNHCQKLMEAAWSAVILQPFFTQRQVFLRLRQQWSTSSQILASSISMLHSLLISQLQRSLFMEPMLTHLRSNIQTLECRSLSLVSQSLMPLTRSLSKRISFFICWKTGWSLLPEVMIQGVKLCLGMAFFIWRSNFDMVQWQDWIILISDVDDLIFCSTSVSIYRILFLWSLWRSRNLPMGQNQEFSYLWLNSSSSYLLLAKHCSFLASSCPVLRSNRYQLAVLMKCYRNLSRMMFSEYRLMSRNVELPYLMPAQLPSMFDDPITVLLSQMISFSWCLLHTSFVMQLQRDFSLHWGFSTMYFPPALWNSSISSLFTHNWTLSIKSTTWTPLAAASMSLQRVVSAAGDESIAQVVIQKQSLALSIIDHTDLKNSSPSMMSLVRGNRTIFFNFHFSLPPSSLWNSIAYLWNGCSNS